MMNDLIYALRSIAKMPLFYAVATVTLALGIGANVAIFTVVNAVLLRPLPYPKPDRLMMVWTYNPRQGFDKDVGTYPNFEDWRRASTSFERMSAYSGASVTLTGSGDPAQIRGGRVTPDFFDTLGVAPARGRVFAAANGQAGGERVVILAHGLWTRRFGADPSVIGRTITLNGVAHEVRQGEELDLTVVDDGQGFDVTAVRNNGGGLGLVTMEERVNLVGGHMSIVSVPGQGTTVRVRGPINPHPLH